MVTVIMKNKVMNDTEMNGVIVIIGCTNTCILVLISDIKTQHTPIWTTNINVSVIRPPRDPNVTLVTSINVVTATAGGADANDGCAA